jgi:hypothetical protein
MSYQNVQILFKGGLLFFKLGIDLSSGRIDVLVTNADLIEWFRSRRQFLGCGNNGLGRNIARQADRSGAGRNRHNVFHVAVNVDSPKTSEEFRLSWENFIQFLDRL